MRTYLAAALTLLLASPAHADERWMAQVYIQAAPTFWGPYGSLDLCNADLVRKAADVSAIDGALSIELERVKGGRPLEPTLDQARPRSLSPREFLISQINGARQIAEAIQSRSICLRQQ